MSWTTIQRREFLITTSQVVGGMVVSSILPATPTGAANSNLVELSATAAVAAIRNGDIKAENYARALLDRAQQLASLNAFRILDREMVLEAARNADKRRASGAQLGVLHGLPIPVKDSVNTKALPTSNGTRALANFRPKDDAAVLKPLFAQGAILMGKTNLHELSFGWTSNNAIFGPVRNPYDPSRVPGGSSGGSAAAVAAWRRSRSARIRSARSEFHRRIAGSQDCGRALAAIPTPASCRSPITSLIRSAQSRGRSTTFCFSTPCWSPTPRRSLQSR